MGDFGKYFAIVIIFQVLGLVASTPFGGLEIGHYNESCPNAEKIVRDYVADHLPSGTPTLAASLLRLHFHDCFVKGCDASVLLDQTIASENKTEKTSPINLSLRGFDFIDGVKKELEKKCPGIVSCADILALAARDAVNLSGGYFWDVPTGRKDGNESDAISPLLSLPFPTDSLATLEAKFQKQGLDPTDMVILSAAHTLGRANCSSFAVRLYNFTGIGDQDPALNSTYADELKRKCPTITYPATVTMDAGSNPKFFHDTSYFQNLLQDKGLFGSDAALLKNFTTKSTVLKLAHGSPDDFFRRFAKAMVKMSTIGVKIDSQGNVRKNCAFVN